MTLADSDPALRRFERDSVAACLAMAAVAFGGVAVSQGVGAATRAALGVVGGGLLMAISYRAIKGAVDVLAGIATDAGRKEQQAADGNERAAKEGSQAAADGEVAPVGAAAPAVLSFGRRAFLAVKFFTRFALLAVWAYVMLTCFRLHPVGVLAGATAPFLAAAVQAGRLSRAGGQRTRH